MADEKRHEDTQRAREALVKQARSAGEGGAPRRPAREGDRKPYGRPAGDKRPFDKREGRPQGDRKPYGRPAGDKRPFDKREGRPQGDRKPYGKPAPQPSEGTPSRRAAYSALKLVTEEKAYSGLALDRVLIAAHLSPADRALATEIFYGTLEHMRKIDHLLGQLLAQEPEIALRNVLRISVYQLMYLERVPESAVCDEAVNLTRALGMERLTGVVNGVLRNFIRKRADLTLPRREDGLTQFMETEYSMPAFVCERLIGQYGEEMAERILAWRGGRHIVVRPNAKRITEREFEEKLTAAKLAWERSRVPGAYRVTGMGPVERNGMYKQGQFSVQGESSLLCAQVLAPRPGMQVLDACAAPGGKSAAMTEMMQGSGRVYACDVHEHRVELIRATAARLGHDGMKARLQDATRFVSEWSGAMDAVLCDAPCSGLGVVANKPDIRLNITEEELSELPALQGRILANCARYVRPGGVLVYSTCTILESENQAVVRQFLADHPDFELDDAAQYVPECFRTGAQDGMLTLLGCRDDVDGFFIARMKRRGGR